MRWRPSIWSSRGPFPRRLVGKSSGSCAALSWPMAGSGRWRRGVDRQTMPSRCRGLPSRKSPWTYVGQDMTSNLQPRLLVLLRVSRLLCPTPNHTARHPTPSLTVPHSGTRNIVRFAPGLRTTIARRLRCAPEQLDVKQPLAHFGLTSRDAVEIAAELEQFYGRQLSPALLYEHPTIDRLAAFLSRDDAAERSAREDASVRCGTMNLSRWWPWLAACRVLGRQRNSGRY